jgi:hypothetical protein
MMASFLLSFLYLFIFYLFSMVAFSFIEKMKKQSNKLVCKSKMGIGEYIIWFKTDGEKKKILDVINNNNVRFDTLNEMLEKLALLEDLPRNDKEATVKYIQTNHSEVDFTGIDFDDLSILPKYRCGLKVKRCCSIVCQKRKAIRVLFMMGATSCFAEYLDANNITYSFNIFGDYDVVENIFPEFKGDDEDEWNCLC